MVITGEASSSQAYMATRSLEDKIRKAILANHVRTEEYLKDFDRLRSGYISKKQFERCLNQHFGITLSAEEESLLLKEYGQNPTHPGMVNYRKFCEIIDSGFNPNVLDVPPTSQRFGADVISMSERRPLSAASLAKVQQVLQRMAIYYKYHGINTKSCYEDFDRHNIGLVTESQFYRSVPGPPDLTETEMRLLAKKYLQEDRPGLCNYLDFHADILRAQEEMERQSGLQSLEISDTVTPFAQATKSTSLHEIFHKMRIAVHKKGIRTTDFFRDHDKLRSGVITENQFVCGLTLCCGNHISLSRAEIQQLVDYYRVANGRIKYKEFCDVMENAFNVPNLEKKPTEAVHRPPIGALATVPNTLPSREEEKTEAALDRLRTIVFKKRLMLYPYFKDFDRAKGYTRGITKTQFSRILHMVGLDVPLSELELLCKKFEYQEGGDINYPAFIQAIDTEYTASAPLNQSKVPAEERAKSSKEKEVTSSTLDVGEIISKIRHSVLVNGLRVEEYFQDFDPLRHGSISTCRFRMGLSAMNQHHLTDEQFMALAAAYADPRKKDHVLWKEFLSDVEIVFTQRNLEKTPTYSLPPQELFVMPKDGSQKWIDWSDDKKNKLESILHCVRQRVLQRRIMVKPCFHDFDRHNVGYVSMSQFRRCVARLDLILNESEMNLVAERFGDSTGFNYISFLEELEPSVKEESMYLRRKAELERVNSKQMKDTGSDDLQSIMEKIKDKIVRERIRVLEFLKDYDHLRVGRILKTVFPRALDLCQLGLTKKECDILMDFYTVPGHTDYVDYMGFSDEVESVFTIKGLEKVPLLQVEQYKPQPEKEYNKVLPDAEMRLEQVIERIADSVRTRRIQLFPLFEDYDRVHNGSVSRSQFVRVMSELELGTLVSASEFELLFQKFDILVGGKHDFNYIAFCDTINSHALFDPRIP